MKKVQKALTKFINSTIKNFNKMKNEIKTALALVAIIATVSSCTVKRVITNESKFVQKNDTAIVIQTKTVETYKAEKGGNL